MRICELGLVAKRSQVHGQPGIQRETLSQKIIIKKKKNERKESKQARKEKRRKGRTGTIIMHGGKYKESDIRA